MGVDRLGCFSDNRVGYKPLITASYFFNTAPYKGLYYFAAVLLLR